MIDLLKFWQYNKNTISPILCNTILAWADDRPSTYQLIEIEDKIVIANSKYLQEEIFFAFCVYDGSKLLQLQYKVYEDQTYVCDKCDKYFNMDPAVNNEHCLMCDFDICDKCEQDHEHELIRLGQDHFAGNTFETAEIKSQILISFC